MTKLPIFLPVRTTDKDTLDCAHSALVRDRLADFLRRQHPMHTAKEVGAKADIPYRTVERWLAGLSAPQLDHFIRLLSAYGPPLLQAALDDEGIRRMERHGFDWVDRLQRTEVEEQAIDGLQKVADALEQLRASHPAKGRLK
jgi:hypothetical protein